MKVRTSDKGVVSVNFEEEDVVIEVRANFGGGLEDVLADDIELLADEPAVSEYYSIKEFKKAFKRYLELDEEYGDAEIEIRSKNRKHFFRVTLGKDPSVWFSMDTSDVDSDARKKLEEIMEILDRDPSQL